jgi:hypothetical protein
MPFRDKAAEKAYHRAYYQANKSRMSETLKAWRAANAEKLRAYNRARRQVEKQKIDKARRSLQLTTDH